MPTDTLSETSSALKAIHAYLDEHPGDMGVRLELADLYADMGDERREGLQRWLAEQDKHPVQIHSEGDWDWYCWVEYYGEQCRLPTDIFNGLSGEGGRYETREEAEDDLATVLFPR